MVFVIPLDELHGMAFPEKKFSESHEINNIQLRIDFPEEKVYKTGIYTLGLREVNPH